MIEDVERLPAQATRSAFKNLAGVEFRILILSEPQLKVILDSFGNPHGSICFRFRRNMFEWRGKFDAAEKLATTDFTPTEKLLILAVGFENKEKSSNGAFASVETLCETSSTHSGSNDGKNCLSTFEIGKSMPFRLDIGDGGVNRRQGRRVLSGNATNRLLPI